MRMKEVEEQLSRCERKLFKVLPELGVKITTAELLKLYYDADEVPRNGRVIITGLVRVVQKKMSEQVDCPYILCTSERAGPKPISVWLALKSAHEPT